MKKRNFKRCSIIKVPEKEIKEHYHLIKQYQRFELSGIPTRFWLPNSEIKVGFKNAIGITQNIKNAILVLANEWCANTSVQFVEETNPANYDVLVSFIKNGGMGSVIGNRSKIFASLGKPSMNLDPTWGIEEGFENKIGYKYEYLRGTIRHEFGHALGFIHEHQRSDRPWVWNKAWMKSHIKLLGLGGWRSIVNNYIKKENDLNNTKSSFDFDSVMIYGFSAKTNFQGISVDDKNYLSALDIETVNLIYPK